MIKAMPIKKDGIKFVVSKKIHLQLCKELKRTVRTYKKIKIESDLCIDENTAYLN